MQPLVRAVLAAALIAMVWSGPTHRVPAQAATPAAATSALYAVATRSSSDVWAVGTKGYPPASAPSYTFIAHWDGTRWRDVSPVLGCTRQMAADVGLGALCAAAPARGLSTTLMGVAALPSGEVWAVGSKLGLVLHWDGSRWHVAWWDQTWNTLPHDLGAVAAVSPRDVWAVGDRAATPPRPGLEALIEHWDGVRWRVVPSPNVAGHANLLFGVAGVSARDVWAVGRVGGYDSDATSKALIEHWDGARWSIVPS